MAGEPGGGASGGSLADFMAAPAEEGLTAAAGAPLDNPGGRADRDAVIEALKSVHDPEIPVNIYDLGLIYEADRRLNGDVEITMTLTAPHCPVAGEMPREVAEAVAAVDGVGRVTVTLTWSPPWTPDQMSDDAKFLLDMF
ncbi:MAG: DUF59 domain-containing protein [Rhodospirillaceae bacterium]|nr:DUF59 domain-containing protein [Rhodospirillaceae bacterium]MYF07322.1 DUF59 domain-containing protein [Rhodospirillaceae bacterium]MYF86630.1 DUF59 domain-containing protein [Rhodospirillaceae bacterium]MYK12807.1 DUF59 domain-containing protein [Rhodospirillaceae bacterium]MYK57650.1 DUF59 domain-containing protein [Rhodospirillaceae bacterium]